MLLIRDAQLAVLGQGLARQFRRRAADHLARHFPEAKAMPDEERLAFVERNVAALQARGFAASNDLVKLLGVLLLFGEDLFEKQAWARALAGGDAGPTLKANRIHDRALAELRAQEA